MTLIILKTNSGINTLNINLNSSAVAERLIKSLASNTPLSVLRMGDGEMVIYHYESADINKLNRFIKDMRIKNENNVLMELKRKLENTIINADIIGLPTSRHLDHGKDWDLIPRTYADIFKSHSILENNKQYCSINLHIEMLNNKTIYTVIQKVKHLVVISSRDLKERFKQNFPNLTHIEYYLIPGEYSYEEKKVEDIMFPNAVEKIIQNLKSCKRNGQLLIYGGGVALDLGSVFDMWAGKVTRGRGKGPHSYNDQYKL